MDENEIKQFLKVIEQIESSGGQNFNHPRMESGIHKGHSAIGRYGLMPNTVNEVLNRMRHQGQITPELEQLKQLDPDSLKETLEQNRELEEQIAQSLAQRVIQRQADPEKAAFSWNQGHNLTPEKIDKQPYKEHDYVKKFNEYRKLMTENE